MRLSILAPVLGAVLASCGGGQTRLNLFSTDWEDDHGATIARVWEHAGRAAIAPSADVVVGIAGRTDKLIGMPLSGGSTWTFAHPLDSRPVVAGSVVVGSGGGEAFALDAKTGDVLWHHPVDGIGLLGAGDDGAMTVASFRRTGGAGSLLLAVAHDGHVARQIETERALGAPAIVDGMVFVPWAGQYVSVIDLANGDETARVTLREQSSRAWTESGALWFGELGFIRFDEHIRDASKGQASTALLPVRDLPGIPKVMPSGYAPVPAASNAEDKTRLYARPEGGEGPVAESDGRWYATYFRLAMGFDTASRQAKSPASGKPASQGGALAWVYVHGADFVGGAAARGGLVLCDERGRVLELDAKTGGVLGEADLGEPVKGCVVNSDERRVAGNTRDVKPLAMQLAEAVLVDDPQLSVIQRLLLRELTVMDDEIATKTLVELASSPRTGPDLLAEARRALAKRRNGAMYMEASLARHYDFLKDVLRAPPVGPMAEALGAMNAKAAAAQLATHLMDPADTDDDVMRTASALVALGSSSELATMRAFFGMYRASADSDEVATAVVEVGRALLALGGVEGRATVEAAAADPTTVGLARERLQEILNEPPAEGSESTKKSLAPKK